jgi:hypothetical protein
MRGVTGGNDVAAEGCRLVTSPVDQVMSAFRRTGRKKLAVFIAGTSRMRYLSHDLFSVVETFGWKYKQWSNNGELEKQMGDDVESQKSPTTAGELNFVSLQPSASMRMYKALIQHKICSGDTDTFNVIMLSFGIWEAAARDLGHVRAISPLAFQAQMRVEVETIVSAVRYVCPDRTQYRIIWISNTAVHAIGNERQAKLPLVTDPPEITFDDSRSELAQAALHMALERDMYREIASKEGDAYVPYYEVTLPARDEYHDHIHVVEKHTSGLVGSKLILTTLRQLFEAGEFEH